MLIRVIKNMKLLDGEVYYDSVEEIETNKTISISMIKIMNEDGELEQGIYLQIGNFLNKDFREIELTKKDTIHIVDQ